MVKIITEFINNWLKEIVVLFIVISIIDIIMPKGKMRTYVNFIIGLLIIFTIISPFTRLNNITLDLDTAVSNFNQQTISRESLIDLQRNQTVEIYTINLRDRIEELIEDNSDYKVKKFSINTLPDDESIFILDEINILLTTKGSSTKTIKVDKIEIDDAAMETIYIDSNSALVDLVANLIQVEPEKINISIEDKEDKDGRNN